MTRILAGFEPFAGRKRNRSWEIVQRVPDRLGVERVRLPVDFARLEEALAVLPDRRPDVLLMVGEWSARKVAVEQIALNVQDSDTPDNAARRPRDEAVHPGAPMALRTSWDARAVADRLTAEGIPAVASFHAGTFACNAALYRALHGLAGTRIGFLHLPRRGWPRGPRQPVLVRAVELGLLSLDD